MHFRYICSSIALNVSGFFGFFFILNSCPVSVTEQNKVHPVNKLHFLLFTND